MAKRFGTLDAPADTHATGKRNAHGTNGHPTNIIDGGLTLTYATKDYMESWRRDAERFEAERKKAEKKEK